MENSVQPPQETKPDQQTPQKQEEKPSVQQPQRKNLTLHYENVDEQDEKLLTAALVPETRKKILDVVIESETKKQEQIEQSKKETEKHFEIIKQRYAELAEVARNHPDTFAKKAYLDVGDMISGKKEIRPEPVLITSYAFGLTKHSVSTLENKRTVQPKVYPNLSDFARPRPVPSKVASNQSPSDNGYKQAKVEEESTGNVYRSRRVTNKELLDSFIDPSDAAQFTERDINISF